MKTRVQITLEDEAVEILDKQENRSQFIEDLILKQESNNLAVEVRRLAMLVDGLVNDIQTIIETVSLVKQKLSGLSSNGRTADFDSANLGSSPSEPASFVPRPPDPELGYPCCTKSTPCKHWAYDGLEGAWKNTLTGKMRDV